MMNGIPKAVFSRTLEKASWSNTTLVREGAEAAVRTMKRESSQNLFVFGSARLSATLTEAQLFDEYRLAIAPVILGSGRPLFAADSVSLRLRLIEARTLSTGCVIARYAPGPVQPVG
jgi:dihydrofolate reductase